MRAVVIREPGGVDVLEVREVPDPEPGPGELLVRNFATALNRADLLQRRGLYPPPPGASEILGLEFAGEVARAGPVVEGFQVGDRVFGLIAGGGYAEFLCVDHRLAVPIPDNLSFDAAAAVPEAFIIAQEALFTLGRLAAGETVLIHAGASGVGSAAIQLARSGGARVVATASRGKLELCLELGAERAVAREEEDFARVVAVEYPPGAAVILDLVGASYWERNWQCLEPQGRLVVAGLLGGRCVELDLGALLSRRLQVLGTVLRTRDLAEKIEVTQRFRARVLPLLRSGEVRAVIDRVYPFEEVRAAHQRMEENRNAGKIVLRL